MHGAWVARAREGDPNHDGLPPWRPYDATRRTTMRFDRISGPVDDLAGVSWRPAWPVPSFGRLLTSAPVSPDDLAERDRTPLRGADL
jgi:hypothetical protein